MNDGPHHLDLDSLRVEIDRLEPETALVRLDGEIDNFNYMRLQRFVLYHIGDDDRAVAIDATRLDFADSGGIKFLETLRRRFGNGRVALKGLNHNLRRLLVVAGYTDRVVYIKEPVAVEDWRVEGREAA